MTNTILLEAAIKKSGLKKGKIAEHLGVSRGGLTNLINGRAEFRISQVLILSDLLGLTEDERDAIFFTIVGV